MPGVKIESYCASMGDLKTIEKEVQISRVQEDFWSSEYALKIPKVTEETDRIEVTCLFYAEEAHYLSHDRKILPLSSKVSPPFPVGCVLWLKGRGILYQIDLPKYPHLRLCKEGDKITAKFVIKDRFGSGFIFWGDDKISRSCFEKQIHIRTNRLRSLEEAVWLEPYPNGARSVICLTDHPDYDSIPKIRLLYELFSENEFRITKGVFPGSDPLAGKTEPGLDVPEYKVYIDMLYESGSEIAYHGISPRIEPPPFPECMRRIQLMSMYSPRTWIDHGCGAYLFSKDAAFKEGSDLVDVLSKAGIKNYWSYTDVWENPARHLNVWKGRRAFNAFSNFASFLWHKKPTSVPLMVYYGSSVIKNLFGPLYLRPIKNHPREMSAWKSVATHARRLKYLYENPLILYDLYGQSGMMSKENIWVFDTVLLNHLAFQLRPANIDLLCRENGLLVAHCYFGHQKSKYGTMNCFVNDGDRVTINPEFTEDVRYISEKQSKKELVTLSFHALRTVLTNFVNASLIRKSSGWEIDGIKVIVGSQQATSASGPNKQWVKEKLYYTEVEGQTLLQMSA
jgi:hypothetical protein